MSSEEMIEFAKEVVECCNHSFLSIEDIENNFRDYGFLVNRNKMIGYTSYMEYDHEKQRGTISYTIEERLKRQQEILLTNFSAFLFHHNDNIKMYYKDIPTKSTMKRFSRYLIDASVDKEFSQSSNINSIQVQEGKGK